MANATTPTTTATGKAKTPTATPAGKSKTTASAATATGKAKTPAATATGKPTTATKAGATAPAPAAGGGVAINPTNLPPDAPGALAWTDYAIKYSQETGVPAEIILAIIQAESGGNQYAVGDSGASVGLFQMHDRGAGYGLTVEQRYDPAVQFEKMIPKIVAAYNQGVALGLVGRDLAVYTGYYAEKPAAGNEANYAYGYDVVTSYTSTGVVTIGAAPTNLPSGGTPAAPWAGWYAKGGSRGAAPLSGYSSDLTAYTGQGVTEGLYNQGPTTFSGGGGGGSPAPYGSGPSNGYSAGGNPTPYSSGPATGYGAASAATGVLAGFFGSLFGGAAYQQSRVDQGDTVELIGTPLGPLGIPKETLWAGGGILVGVILIAGGVFLIARKFD